MSLPGGLLLNESDFSSGFVDNAPPAAEMIAFNQSGSNTLSFSQAITDPIMAIVSMGGLGTLVAYDFDQPFTVLSKGHGRWGDGWYTLSDGDLLAGHELHCVIQFTGNISSINWTNYPNENWHGITIGAPATATSPVPEPSPRLLLCFGLFGLVGVKKKFS